MKKIVIGQILFRKNVDTEKNVSITPVEVSWVGKLFFKIIGGKDKYQISDLMYFGYGYHRLYLTEQEIWDEIDRHRIGEKIRYLFQGFTKIMLPLEKLRQIEAILDEPEQEPAEQLKMEV